MTDITGPVKDVGSKAVEAMAALLGEATPGSVFSEPVTVGSDLVIMAAAWERGGGFGFGGGGDKKQGIGVGSGGGGGAQGRPVAVIRIGPKDIDVRPVIDFTKIGITLVITVLAVWKALRR